MAALGPILDPIVGTTGLNSGGVGMLTTVPVFLMGLGALGGRTVRDMLGQKAGISLGIALIAGATASRLLLDGAAGMIASAAAAGLGIALVQALLPGVIKAEFGPATGRVMGLYTTGIMGGAAIAAASAADLAGHLGWQGTLALWSLPAFAALALWGKAAPGASMASESVPLAAPSGRAGFWRNRRAWALMLFFGVGTGAYTLVLAWLPPFYVSLGRDAATGGYLLAGLTLTEVLAGLAVSALASRFPDRRAPLLLVLTSLLAGLACLIEAPLTLALPAIVLLGLGIGSLFPLSLILTLDHVDEPKRAGDLAAFVQGGGYLIASLMPFLAGWIKDSARDLTGAWILMAAGVLLLIVMAAGFSPASYSRITASRTSAGRVR